MPLILSADRVTVRPGGFVNVSINGLDENEHGYVAAWEALAGDFDPIGDLNLFTFETKALSGSFMPFTGTEAQVRWEAGGVEPGPFRLGVRVYPLEETTVVVLDATPGGRTPRDVVDAFRAITLGEPEVAELTIDVVEPNPTVRVSMLRTANEGDPLQALNSAIRLATNSLSFDRYSRFMDVVLCGAPADTLTIEEIRSRRDEVKHRLRLPFPDTDAYRQLKVATEVFMMLNCGVEFSGEDGSAGWTDRLLPEDVITEGRRYGRTLSGPGEIEMYWQHLLREGGARSATQELTILYLAIVRNKLRGVDVVSQSSLSNPVLQQEEAVIACQSILLDKLTHPCFLELIWNYWHEEGMLVQSMNAITWRFQNRRGNGERDPLALMEIDPLRPLNNFIWGYVQDEQHRLTPVRRSYEYDHHYGLTLLGRAVPDVRGADSRTRFLEAFHNLLFLCSIYFKEDDDTTVVADGFPILNALKEVHLLLTQGAHNQYGDLPWTARQEMLMQQWLLARPEFREFLPRRIMVDYPEEWMDSVETMKTLQGWDHASVLHFRDLGVFGEQVLLSIRYAAWPSIIESGAAANWARYWRPEIQGYIHAYRAVTGVDLTERVDGTIPSILLRQRLQAQLPAGRTLRRLPAPVGAPVVRRVPRPALPWGSREN